MKKNEVCASCGYDGFGYGYFGKPDHCSYCGKSEFIDAKEYKGPKPWKPGEGGNPRGPDRSRRNSPRFNPSVGRYRG